MSSGNSTAPDVYPDPKNKLAVINPGRDIVRGRTRGGGRRNPGSGPNFPPEQLKFLHHFLTRRHTESNGVLMLGLDTGTLTKTHPSSVLTQNHRRLAARTRHQGGPAPANMARVEEPKKVDPAAPICASRRGHLTAPGQHGTLTLDWKAATRTRIPPKTTQTTLTQVGLLDNNQQHGGNTIVFAPPARFPAP